MFSPSQKNTPLLVVKKEECTMPDASENEKILLMEKRSLQSVDMKKQKALFVPSYESPRVKEDDICHLSGNPFFDVILVKSHVNTPYQLCLPANIVQVLPRVTVPVVLRCSGKNWNLSYHGDSGRPRFCPKWKTFVSENDLKYGDACVFELMENNIKILKFKVHILRGDLPPELLAAFDSRGKTSDSPIIVD